MEVTLPVIALLSAILHIWNRFLHPQPEAAIYLVNMDLCKVGGQINK
jgi:hypothetical protein